MRPLVASSLLVLGSTWCAFVACQSGGATKFPDSVPSGEEPDGSDPNNECVGTQCRDGGMFGIGVPGGGVGGAGGASGGEIGGGEIPKTFVCPDAAVPSNAALLGVEAEGAEVEFHLNQVGYEQLGAKRAVVEATEELSRFQVVRESDSKVVYEGELISVPDFVEWNSDREHLVANFSDMQEEGTFVLRANGESSDSFTVGSGELFARTAQDVLSFFKQSRADEADTEIWEADGKVSFFGGSGENDVRGGWYDASGDLSKYLSHLSYANFMNPQQIPMTAWVLSWMSEEAKSLLESSGLDEAVREEALFGADYLVRAQSESGFFYINVFDGWSGNADSREICAFEGSTGTKTGDYQAAFREGGGVSIAALARASSLGAAGAFSSADYLAAAELGFAHLLENNEKYADDGKENIIDDYTALMAAVELFVATDKEEYLTHARLRASNLGERLTERGYFIADDGERPYFHAAEAGLPVIALVRFSEVETDEIKRDEALSVVERHLAYLVTVSAETQNPYGYARQHFRSRGALRSGFFIPHDNETGYWWQGESARLGSLAAAAILGGRALSEEDCGLGVQPELAIYASDQLDWILGKNPLDISMLAGYGKENPPEYCSVKDQYHGHHVGGISNGITGQHMDGAGIQWRSPVASGDQCWEDWRWVEQWLPHSTWYLLAITAMADQD